MIFKETILKNVDNSGIVWSKCINIEGRGNKLVSKLGDRVLISVFRAVSKQKLKKKIYTGLIVGVTSFVKRKDGSFIRFFENNVLLLSDQLKFFGTRIYGPVPKELKFLADDTLYKKIVSYSWII